MHVELPAMNQSVAAAETRQTRKSPYLVWPTLKSVTYADVHLKLSIVFALGRCKPKLSKIKKSITGRDAKGGEILMTERSGAQFRSPLAPSFALSS